MRASRFRRTASVKTDSEVTAKRADVASNCCSAAKVSQQHKQSNREITQAAKSLNQRRARIWSKVGLSPAKRVSINASSFNKQTASKQTTLATQKLDPTPQTTNAS